MPEATCKPLRSYEVQSPGLQGTPQLHMSALHATVRWERCGRPTSHCQSGGGAEKHRTAVGHLLAKRDRCRWLWIEL